MSALGKLKDLKIKLVSLVTNGANQAADVVLLKSADQNVTTSNGTVATLTTEQPMADETLKAEIQKAVTEAVAHAVKDRDDKITALEKGIKDRDETVAKIQADRTRETYIARAKQLDLPGASPDDFAGILEAAERGMTDAQKKSFGEMLNSWSALTKQSGVFAEVGSSRPGATGSGAKLESLAKALQAQEPKLTYQKAYSRVLKEQPELYRQYLAEKGGR